MSRFVTLGAGLAAACRQSRIQTARLGCVVRDTAVPQYFVCDSDAEVHGAAGALPAMPLLCGAKLLTSLLVLQTCTRLHLPLEQPLARVLSTTQRQDMPEALLCTTLTQLLAHTHGLGGTLLERASFLPDGRIDLAPITAALAQEGILHPPGRYYGYGVIGYLVLGWLLEQLYGQRYVDILHEQLLAPLATPELPPVSAPYPVCPASGQGLALPLPWMMALCQHLLKQAPTTRAATAMDTGCGLVSQIMQHQVPLPGWSMQIQASCLGWRHFGAQWYGHNGLAGDALFWLRLNPERGLALCLLARTRGGNPGLLPACLLAPHYPELVMSPASWPAIDQQFRLQDHPGLAGCYGSPCRQYRVFEQDGHLQLEIACAVDGTALVPVHRSWLYPAQGRLFYLARPWRRVVFVQFITDDAATVLGLWDHDVVWERLGSA